MLPLLHPKVEYGEQYVNFSEMENGFHYSCNCLNCFYLEMDVDIVT